MNTVLFQPTRGHQCKVLGRWVKAEEAPYPMPADDAARRLRHGLGKIVTDGLDAMTVAELRALAEDMAVELPTTYVKRGRLVTMLREAARAGGA